MKWEEPAIEIIRSEFRNKVFSTNDAFNVLSAKKGYSKGTVYRVLHDLCKKGFAERLGRGIYKIREHKKIEIEDRIKISDNASVEIALGTLKKAKEILRKKGIDYMITGSSLLHRYSHLFPKRLIHLIYVLKGAGEMTVISLREEGLRALLNPIRKETSLALEISAESDIFIVRECSELLGNMNGNACLERALVDLYFETTRKKIPFPEDEASRIIANTLRNEHISFSRLFFYANRRGIGEELKTIAKAIEPGISVKIKEENRYARKFLATMEKGMLR